MKAFGLLSEKVDATNCLFFVSHFVTLQPIPLILLPPYSAISTLLPSPPPAMFSSLGATEREHGISFPSPLQGTIESFFNPQSSSSGQFTEWVDNNGWIILISYRIISSGSGGSGCSVVAVVLVNPDEVNSKFDKTVIFMIENNSFISFWLTI